MVLYDVRYVRYEVWNGPKINWLGIIHHFPTLKCVRHLIFGKLSIDLSQFLSNHPKTFKYMTYIFEN